MATESKAADEFKIEEGDSPSVQALKHTGRNLSEHIAKREKHAKTVTGEEAAGHQTTLAEEKARLVEVRKALK